MQLIECSLNQEYIIKDINLSPNIKKRLQALGLVKETPVKIMANNIKGSMVIKVRGSRLVLGNEITEQICVTTNKISLGGQLLQEEVV